MQNQPMQLQPVRLSLLDASDPQAFGARVKPTGLLSPYWVGRSHQLADELGLAPAALTSPAALEILAGNAPAPGGEPFASVYSGHQFGVWAGQLGDGRAHLLGSVQTPQGRVEFQLKGAGRTPYSRGGDGRAVLRSSIREFLASEAMHALGIASTRALAVVGSDSLARRETNETTAVVTRIAPSFIRFGHFEHFAYQGDNAHLKMLADDVIQQFYPKCQQAANPYSALLQAVVARTALLIAQWQATGFCHGVMNTDNMSILGLTLDYGPFQWLDGFDPTHRCNHSDELGRYAYQRQPSVAYWNLACLAQALLPLIESVEADIETAQTLALQALEPYQQEWAAHYQTLMAAKLGLQATVEAAAPQSTTPQSTTPQSPIPQSPIPQPVPPQTLALMNDLLQLLAQERVDYPLFWRTLSRAVAQGIPAAMPQPAGGDCLLAWQRVCDLFIDQAAIASWLAQYQSALQAGVAGKPYTDWACRQVGEAMLKVNPKFVLRNHMAQTAIVQAQDKDFGEVARLLRVLQTPFDEHPDCEDLALAPPAWAAQLHLSCSS